VHHRNKNRGYDYAAKLEIVLWGTHGELQSWVQQPLDD